MGGVLRELYSASSIASLAAEQINRVLLSRSAVLFYQRNERAVKIRDLSRSVDTKGDVSKGSQDENRFSPD